MSFIGLQEARALATALRMEMLTQNFRRKGHHVVSHRLPAYGKNIFPQPYPLDDDKEVCQKLVLPSTLSILTLVLS